MEDVERVFRQLVTALSDTDPGRLRAPIEIAEIYQTILPYRRYRTALQFETNQDYEMALLKLLAGEGGYVSVDPAEVQHALKAEAEERNPNPAAFRDYAAAKVFLNVQHLQSLADEHRAYAPPQPEPDAAEQWAPPDEPPPPVEPAVPMPFLPAVDEAPPPPEGLTPATPVEPPAPPSTCRRCGRTLPSRADVRYCPHCGVDVTAAACLHCGVDMEPGWRFCVACGRSASPDARE